MEQTIWNLVSMVIGGLITWLVSRHYYKKSGDELVTAADALKSESAKLRDLVSILANGLSNEGYLKGLVRDSQGYITGLAANITGGPAASRGASGTASGGVEQANDDKQGPVSKED